MANSGDFALCGLMSNQLSNPLVDGFMQEFIEADTRHAIFDPDDLARHEPKTRKTDRDSLFRCRRPRSFINHAPTRRKIEQWQVKAHT